jgi:histidinol-phosphatase
VAYNLDDLELAQEAALAGAAEGLRHFAALAGLPRERKQDGSVVTAADRAVEDRIREVLTGARPGDTILGEEHGETTGAGGRRWIIDPIDGTKAFTCGVPLYSNLLALEDEHGIAVGVVHLPALGETVWAGRGLGCWSEQGRARVSTHPRLAGAYVMSSSFSHWAPGRVTALEAAGAVLRTWGDGYGYALVATGRVAAMVDPTVEPYDIGPMPVLMAEAGGRFTDLDGDPGIEAGSGVATNGHVHDELLSLLRAG